MAQSILEFMLRIIKIRSKLALIGLVVVFSLTHNSGAPTVFAQEVNEQTEEADVKDEPSDEEIAAYNAFKEQEGVIARGTGLLIKIIEQGTGPILPPGTMVSVNYEGRLYDGTVFDSSYDRGQPAVFPSNQVIDGWIEALLLMRVGSKWEIVLTPDLGYGRVGSDNIPPYSVLFFTVELLGRA